MTNIETQDPVQESAAAPENGGGLVRSMRIFLMALVLMNSIGFTIIMPVAPYIVQQYLGTLDLAAVVGWLAASYAVCQFVATPALGALSDRYGRRPLLLICLLGSAIGYLIFGIGGALWVLFLGRIIDGITGGNIGILLASVGDVTAPEERGPLFGQFGALVGVGFIVGPVVGGFAANFGYAVPLYLSAGIMAISTLWAYGFMPETLRPEHRNPHLRLAELNPITQIGKLFAIARLRWLLVVGICYGFPFALFTTELYVLAISSLHWTPAASGLMALLIGGTDIVMQGMLAGRLMKRFGEIRLMIAGLIAQSVSYVLIGAVALVQSNALMLAGIFLFAFASGLLEPALGALVSAAAGPRDQGTVQGGNQAIRALTNIVGPLVAGGLYTGFGGAAPFWLGGAILLLGIGAALRAVAHLPARLTSTEREELSHA